MGEDAESDSVLGDGDRTEVGEQRWKSDVRLAVTVGAVVVVAVAVLAGWKSYGAWSCYQTEQKRESFLQFARQSAQDMTTISHARVESDVQRILDLSIGQFHDDFAQRRQPFIDHIKSEKSVSQGTVTEAGLESVGGDSARALVTVAVKLTKADNGEQKLDGLRLRINLQQVRGAVKVSDVEYVQ